MSKILQYTLLALPGRIPYTQVYFSRWYVIVNVFRAGRSKWRNAGLLVTLAELLFVTVIRGSHILAHATTVEAAAFEFVSD